MKTLKKIWDWLTVKRISYFINGILLFMLIGFFLWYHDHWGMEQCYTVNWDSLINNFGGMMMFWVAGWVSSGDLLL